MVLRWWRHGRLLKAERERQDRGGRQSPHARTRPRNKRQKAEEWRQQGKRPVRELQRRQQLVVDPGQLGLERVRRELVVERRPVAAATAVDAERQRQELLQEQRRKAVEQVIPRRDSREGQAVSACTNVHSQGNVRLDVS